MNILDKIVEYKRQEVAERKRAVPVTELERTAGFAARVRSARQFLTDPSKTGIIAEFKRRSPSKGAINEKADVTAVTAGYVKGGASCLSVLTDGPSFGGSADDLDKARRHGIPVLRKDFIIDEYQVVETKSMGADILLLIAACLTPAEVKRLAVLARSIGLEVLLEIHNEDELGHICEETELVGVNNRDLKTFTVDIERSIRLSERIPAGVVKIAESGINQVETIVHMRRAGFQGFLIGENFMKEADPGEAFRAFVARLTQAR